MKENKIEKLILDLSTRWDCSPQDVVDRLNYMNESEINKLIKSMTKKFQYDGGGNIGRQEAVFPNNEYYSIEESGNEILEKASAPGKVLYRRIRTRYPRNGGMPVRDTLITRGNVNTNDQITNLIDITSPHKGTTSVASPELWNQLNSGMDKRRNEALSFQKGGIMKCLQGGKTYAECKKCGGNLIRKGTIGIDTKEIIPDLSRYKFYGRDWYTNNDGSKYSVETVATKREDLPANWDTNPEAQQNMGEFDPDIMKRIIEKGDTLLFRNNYFVPKGSGDWKNSNAVIDSLGVKAGVKKKEMGGVLPLKKKNYLNK